MSNMLKLVMGCLIVLAMTDEGFAQRFTVQQPVVSQFRVGTSVSVPDRGSMLLGSVGRAGSSRLTTGPFRSGSSVGRFTEHRSARVAVYIHDFEELERQLLGETGVTGRSPQRLSEREPYTYEWAMAQLRARSQSAAGPSTVMSGNVTPATQRPTASATSAYPTSNLAETSYGRARIARRRNFDAAWSRLQKPRQFPAPTSRNGVSR